MLNVAHSGDLQGVDIIFLLHIEYRNQIYRFSSRDVVLYDGDIPYYYEGNLGEVDIEQSITNEFKPEGDSVPIEVIFTDIDLVKERLLGHTLDLAPCELFYCTVRDGVVLQDYNEKIPLSRGKIADPVFGAIDVPIGHVTFSIENGRDIDMIPLLTGSDIIPEGGGKGKFRPIILGRPCGYILTPSGNSIFSLPSSPAYFYNESSQDRIYIAAHPVEASQVIAVDQDGTQETRTVTTTANFSYIVKTGSSLNVDDNNITKIFIRWDSGGGLKNPTTGDAIQGVGDLLRYMVQYSGVPFDGDALEGIREYLNIWRCDGYINEDIDALEFIENNIMPLFPVVIHNGARGIRPILDLYNATMRQSPVVTIQDNSDFLIVSGLDPMGDISQVCNNLIFRCAYSAEKEGYVQTIEIDPRVELYNTTSVKFSTVHAEASYNRYGLRTKILESDIVGDFSTASSIAKDYVRRHAFVPIKVTVQANVAWGWLDLGDIVKVSSTRLHLEGYLCQVVKKSWQGSFWSYDLRIDDSSLYNPRPVDEVEGTETISPSPSTSGDYDTTTWFYRVGNSMTVNDSGYKPRLPFAAVDGENVPIWTFWGGTVGQNAFISYSGTFSGNVNVKFKIIRGGGGSGQPTYNVKLANNSGSRVFHLGGYDWSASKTVLIQKASDGYTDSATWSTIHTITKSDITNQNWTQIDENFTLSGEYLRIVSTITGTHGWGLINIEFIN